MASLGNQALPESIQLENGKKLTLWTVQQMQSLSANALRLRALDTRDAIGSTKPIPRHPDDLLEWILNIQCEITGAPPTAFGKPKKRADTDNHSVADSSAEHQSRFADAGRIKTRNMGTNNLLSWSTEPVTSRSVADTSNNEYASRRADADRIKARNMGAGNLLSWN